MNRFKSLLPVVLACLLLSAGTAHAGYTLTTLASFNRDNGANPYAALTVSGNTLYGTTFESGANSDGTVFSVPITGGTPTVLASFNGSNGQYPYAGLTLAGNTLYGTTEYGGVGGGGTVFSVPITGGTLTVLASFNGSNGYEPYAGLTLSGNTLYGTTCWGGANGDGTVFSVPITGGTPTILTSFNGSNGENPQAGLTLSGSTLYGTTYNGAADGWGTVFSIPTTGGTPTIVASFSGPNGQHPFTSLTLSGSTLYGTTAGGGAGYNPSAGNYGNGTVFSVPSTGGTPTVLASFNGSNGQYPYAGVTLSGNTLYGTTPYGGTDSEGNIFSVPITGGTPTVLVSFTSNSHSSGQWPFAGLILSGNALYGTTFVGGANGDGTVFALTPNAIISLTATAPAAFGVQVGTLAVVGGNGKYKVATATFPATPTGYVAVSGFNPASDTENYALHITDSVGANLAADLADAASEINAFTYTGYSLTASTIDPTGGSFGSGYNFFLTVTGSTLGSSPYLGFDFTQLNGITDTLSVDNVAVPEPGSASLLLLGAVAIFRRRNRK